MSCHPQNQRLFGVRIASTTLTSKEQLDTGATRIKVWVETTRNQMTFAVGQRGKRMSDLISRQDAIEQAKELFTLGGCYCDQPSIIGMLNALPSAEPEVLACGEGELIAEPEKRTNKRTETHACDLISRQAAIDALQSEINEIVPPFDNTIGAIRCGIRLSRNIIEDLPYERVNKCENCASYEIAKNGVNGFCNEHNHCMDSYEFCSRWRKRGES